MFKCTLTYDNYDDEPVTEDFYFHLSELDLLELESSKVGGFENYLKEIIAAKDMPTLITLFKDLINRSYGIKAEGGKFYKSPDIIRDFEASAAYSEMFTKLATDEKFASEFVMGVIPKRIREDIAKEMKNQQ